jgi:hypothetical protein
MGQVDPQPMTATAADVAGAIVRAYQTLKGSPPPSDTSWLFPLALSSNETAGWKSFFNFNLGNITTLGSGVDWYLNPHVTNGLKFRSYGSLDEGALGMLKTLQADGGLAAADAGDEGAFQSALNAYLGGSIYPNLSGLISRLSSTVPSSGWAPSIPSQLAPLILTASIGFLAATVVSFIDPTILPKWARVSLPI